MRDALRRWWYQLFFYPTQILTLIDEDYDAYWRVKRGAGKPSLNAWQKERAELVTKVIKKDGLSNPVIADIGCGDGALLAAVLVAVPGARGVGYDSSEVARDLATDAGIHETKFLDLRTDPELAGVESADYILLLETLEHVTESEKVLAVAMKKARRGVFISFPNTGFFTYRLRLLFGKFPAQWIRMPNEHVRFWTLRDLRWWLHAQGYRDARVVTYQGFPGLGRVWPALFAGGLFVSISHV